MSRSYSDRCVEAGWIAGWIAGFGMSGFWWMNPYIALSLLLGGTMLAAVALAAARRAMSGAFWGWFGEEVGRQKAEEYSEGSGPYGV